MHKVCTLVSKSQIFSFPVSTPNISFSVPSGPLYAGTSLTLTCVISLNPATDNNVRIEGINVTWFREDSQPSNLLSNNTARVLISATFGSHPTFSSTLTLSPLSIRDTRFICSARARPPSDSHFITQSETGRQTVNVTVQSKPFTQTSYL